MIVNDSSFFSKISQAKKVLVLDLGFLGDTIHLFPALYLIRQALPEAELHVMASSHVAEILELLPWVDRILGYPRFPKRPTLFQDIPRCWKFFKAGYDVLINLNGSQCSSYLSAATLAPYRLGRLNERPFPLRSRCFSHYIDFPYGTMHVAKQRYLALLEQGFPDAGFKYDITLPKEALRKLETLNLKNKGFIHISPFSSLDSKDLPLPLVAECLNSLHDSYPQLDHVISCAPNARETQGLESLLSLLDYQPSLTIKGTFSTLELAALIQKARLHIGADSGPMHLAALWETPTLIWTRNDPNSIIEWMPSFASFRYVIGEASSRGLQGLKTQDILEQCETLLMQTC
jgi:ADP-heptose:LPS heptosyltransferase